jgi:hypothetical protein
MKRRVAKINENAAYTVANTAVGVAVNVATLNPIGAVSSLVGGMRAGLSQFEEAQQWQGLTLVHFSAQRKRFLLDRERI